MGTVLAWGVLLSTTPGRAETSAPDRGSQPKPSAAARGQYAHAFGTLAYGYGLRLNNPFRLQTELGSDSAGLSLTSGYLDLGAGISFGPAAGFHHGGMLKWSLATQGVAQQVLSGSYVLDRALLRDLWWFGRAGVPLVFQPDFTLGLEAATGAAYLFSGALGLTAEVGLGIYQGAATWEHDPTLWPVLSFQLGVLFDYEVLP